MTKVSSKPSGSQASAWLTRRAAWLRALERLALALEKPVNALTGTSRLNPFYYTGPIAVFLLLLVILTGLYLFFLFQYGFEASYQSVVKVESQFVTRIVRAVHRYASDAAVIVSLLHAFRILFMERFRGSRWLAWVSGVVMMAILWLCGITGYWLIWDQRAQLITASFTNFLRQYTPLGTPFALWLMSAEATDQSWILMFVLAIVHILSSAIIIGLYFWLHIRRLNRPGFLPGHHWMIGLGLILVVVSAVVPAGMLPKADFSLLPGPVTLDPIFAFFLPTGLSASSEWLWGVLVAVLAVALVVPWLSFRRQQPPRVVIDQDRCTGCTRCSTDCPYKAITMAACTEEKAREQVAIANPALCVSCGICIGSCNTQAISLGDLSVEALWQAILTRLTLARGRADEVKVILTCERHAAHGARPYLNQGTSQDNGRQAIEVIPLPCVGAAHPDLLTRTLEAGAAQVLVIGCPPDDCAQREGNLRMKERLARLKPALQKGSITAAWLPPDAFSPATRTNAASEQGHLADSHPRLNWRNLVPAFAFLAVLFGLQVWLTGIPYKPYSDTQALIQVAGRHLSQGCELGKQESNPSCQTRLMLDMDGQTILEKVYRPAGRRPDGTVSIFEQIETSPGKHHVRLSLVDAGRETPQVLFDETVYPGRRQVLGLTFED